MTCKFLCGLTAMLTIAVIIPSDQVSAQSADGATEDAESNENSSEIIVTARKREERLVDVPIAVSVFTGNELENRGAANLGSFLQDAPGVAIVDQGNGLQSIAIRGVTSLAGGNPNGYYLDELPFTGLTTPIAPDVRAWDLDRVEVLRGPQGTLFGEGSVGGTIRILTKGPQFNNWEARGLGFVSATDNASGANTGLKGAINVPLVNDILAVRVAATTEHYDGWIDDRNTGRRNLNDQKVDTFRAKVRFDPTEKLTLNGSYWLYDARFPFGPALASDDNQISQAFVSASGLRYELLGASANYSFGGAELFYGYANNSFDLPNEGSFAGGRLDSAINIETESHELRLASTGDQNLQWTIGVYQRIAQRSDSQLIEAFAISSETDTRSRARAVFGESSYRFGDTGIEATAGVRYFEERLSGNELNSGVPSVLPSGTFDSWNPRFTLAWRASDDLNIYATAAKGFRSGQLQYGATLQVADLLGIPVARTTSQDALWSYEAGVKANLLDRMVGLEAAIYHTRWRDVASLQPLSATGLFALVDTPGTRTTGAEAAITVRPAAGLNIAASVSYAAPEYVGSVPGTGIDKGEIVDGTSRFTANASLDYRRSLGPNTQGFGRIGWQHRSPQLATFLPANLPGDTIDLVDARLGIALDRFSISAFADNLFNERGATSYRTVGFFDTTANRLRPRTIGIEVSLRFEGE